MGRSAQPIRPAAIHMPQSSGRQRTSNQATDTQRERILEAAAELFGTQGYAGTTLAQIARALGVTKPFVYYYFKDKQEIFETLSWRPTVACFTSMDFAPDDARPAREKVLAGLDRMIRSTLAHAPCAFFPYREPQVYRPEYLAAQRRLARHFYDRLCPLLEEGRRQGDFDFDDAHIAARAACSLPGFLYVWWRPEGRLPADRLAAQLLRLSARMLGLPVSRELPTLDP